MFPGFSAQQQYFKFFSPLIQRFVFISIHVLFNFEVTSFPLHIM